MLANNAAAGPPRQEGRRRLAPVLCAVGKLALIKQQRYAHAKQFKRANKSLRTLKIYLRRVIGDIQREIAGDETLKAVFAHPLSLGHRVLTRKKRQDAPKAYSLHASIHPPACGLSSRSVVNYGIEICCNSRHCAGQVIQVSEELFVLSSV